MSITIYLVSSYVMLHILPGYPPPVVHWRKEDGALPPDHQVQDGVLHINRARVEYAGTYVCIARNQAGQESARVTLNVDGQLASSVPYIT